jgi:myo-inositol-1(or 4)-monophosphatase
VRGQDATRNDKKLHSTTGDDYDFSRMAGPKPLVQRLSDSPDEIELHPRIGSLALRLCRVAQGSLDAAFAGGQSRDWDLAAANLIVQEANGNMTALSGDPILYNRREVTHGVLVAYHPPRPVQSSPALRDCYYRLRPARLVEKLR